jgi:glycosyltransferase involved in cell wall biosynthesis
MRLVIDLQCAQSSSSGTVIGKNALALTHALANAAGENEVWVVLNDAFSDEVEVVRSELANLIGKERIRVFPSVKVPKEEDGFSWVLTASEKIREGFLADLAPDLVLVLNVFEGLVDPAVVSIGSFERSAPTVVFLHDLMPLEDEFCGWGDEKFRQWYQRQLQFLRSSDLILTVSGTLRANALSRLHLDPSIIVDISPAVIPVTNCLDQQIEKRDLLEKEYGLTSRNLILHVVDSNDHKCGVLINRTIGLFIESVVDAQMAVLCEHPIVIQDGLLTLSGLCSAERELLFEMATIVVVSEDAVSDLRGVLLKVLKTGAAVLLVGDGTCDVEKSILDCCLLVKPEALSSGLRHLYDDPYERFRLRELGYRLARYLLWEGAAQKAWAEFQVLLDKRSAARPPAIYAPANKPRLAYFSPLPPAQSGIADYSVNLLPELSFYYDIDVIVDQEQIESDVVNACFPVRNVHWFNTHFDEYDRVLYHFGNSPFHNYMLSAFDKRPGTVVLHDFYLGHLFSYPDGATPQFISKMYESHGYHAVLYALRTPEPFWRFPSNLSLIARAHGVIVHSNHAIELVRKWYGDSIRSNLRKVEFLRAPSHGDRNIARARLGIPEDTFLVCSFGLVGEAKLNRRLLSAWVGSRLTRAQNCQLVYVGGGGGPYHDALNADITACKNSYDVSLTGFASAELYSDYLDAADVAVQLRSSSRGETSAAVFDCFAHKTALIVNSHGSMSELPEDSVFSLPDSFEDEELVKALEELWVNVDRRAELNRTSTEYLSKFHSPQAVSQSVVGAIEHFNQNSLGARRTRLIESIATTRAAHVPSQVEAISVARALDEAFPDSAVRTLFVDVSAVVRVDLKTGIQRVTRALLLEFLTNPPEGWRVEPVYLSGGTDKQFHYARTYTQKLLDIHVEGLLDEPVRPLSGDILLGLDLYWGVADIEPAYMRWRALGVSIQFVVYDLLPILQPEHFPSDTSAGFPVWLNFITRVSDGLLCISNSVASDMAAWVKENAGSQVSRLRIEAFPLGADIQTSAPSKGLPQNAEELLTQIATRPSILMVGTVEPRKKHIQALDAMEYLWGRGVEINFVVVGKQGWLNDADALRLHNHPELGNRFFWLTGVSDEYLDKIYEACSALLAASSGEGFGLPLIEAAVHGLPVIARDIPVFREVAGDYAFYFSGNTGSELGSAIEEWLDLRKANGLARSLMTIEPTTWSESAASLLSLVLDISEDGGKNFGLS